MALQGAVRGSCRSNFQRSKDLALKYVPLVFSIVRDAGKSIGSDGDPEDLVGCGFLALMRAARRFEPSRGRNFVSYVAPAIRGAVLDEARSRDWLSRGGRRRVRKLEATLDRLQNSMQRRTTYADAAHMLNLSADQSRSLQRALCCAAPMPTVEMDGDADAASFPLPAAPPESDPHDIAVRRETRKMVADAVERLPERERQVVELYYFHDHTLREIGDRLGVTESRVCQIHGRALRRLRERPELASLLAS